MNKLLECSQPPWLAWSPSDSPSLNPNQTWLLHGPNPLSLDKSLGYSEADATLLAAAFDHALIWWAIKYEAAEFHEDISGTYEVVIGTPAIAYSCDLDPFGFPILTDDLRARLIAEMEATQ